MGLLGKSLAAMAVCVVGLAQASAAIVTADVVLDFHDSGAGPIAGPYGGSASGVFPTPVSTDLAVDGDSDTFVSLPTGSFLTVGFSGGAGVFDGPGNDIFISEPGANSELADIFVSSDFGLNFTFLGQADGGVLTELDLADIGFVGIVNAIKIVGLDNLGGSPGFDVSFVQGLEGSSVPAPVPVPAALPMFLVALGAGSMLRRKPKAA